MAKKKKTSKRTRKSKLETVGTQALEAELRRRQRTLTSLERKHARLMDQLGAVEAEIDALGGLSVGGPTAGTGRSTGRKRPKNDMKLDDALVKLLKNKTMGVTEASEAVQKAGYKTTAANFRTIVNQTLIRSPKIKKVARGQYTAK